MKLVAVCNYISKPPFLSFGLTAASHLETLFVRGSSHAICAISATSLRNELNLYSIVYFGRPEIWANFCLGKGGATSHATTS